MKFFRTLGAVTLAATIATVPALGNADVLIDEDVQINPARVRPLEFDVKVKGTRVLCTFHVEEGRSGVRAVLLKRADVKLWLADRPHSILAATDYEDSGGFSWLAAEPGAYSIVLDNRLEGRDSAVVRLQVRLVSGEGINAAVQPAGIVRARVVIWTSVLLFLVLTLFSGWRVYLAVQRRRLRRAAPGWLRPTW